MVCEVLKKGIFSCRYVLRRGSKKVGFFFEGRTSVLCLGVWGRFIFKSYFHGLRHLVVTVVEAGWHLICRDDHRLRLIVGVQSRRHLLRFRRHILAVVAVVLRAFVWRFLLGFCSRQKWLRGGARSVVAVVELVREPHRPLG